MFDLLCAELRSLVRVRSDNCAKQQQMFNHTLVFIEWLNSCQNDVVQLRVGAQVYTTTKSTLCVCPDSMLSVMFSKDTPFQNPTSAKRQRLESEVAFEHCDGNSFQLILQYLRDGANDLPAFNLSACSSPKWLQQLMDDCAFFGLQGLQNKLTRYKPVGLDFTTKCKNGATWQPQCSLLSGGNRGCGFSPVAWTAGYQRFDCTLVSAPYSSLAVGLVPLKATHALLSCWRTVDCFMVSLATGRIYCNLPDHTHKVHINSGMENQWQAALQQRNTVVSLVAIFPSTMQVLCDGVVFVEVEMVSGHSLGELFPAFTGLMNPEKLAIS
eukprot:TRINITY_DN47057_c0_g1_i1.p1 TRINITY_DN47057_c0_g1~~TRINITY_DN47057_c0_g1_i1.p1  ORF type:complete len:325 (-),score=6.09 TRINITY_DN47057_c0_g1_i1:63-1037(-)